jgi:hypothetical protein
MSEHPYAADLKNLDDLLNFTDPDIKAGNLSFRLWHIEPFYFLVIASWIKTFKTTKSIRLLCEHGLSRDAEALLRVLIEATINLLYLSKEDQDNRTRWYVDYLSLNNKKLDGILGSNKGLRSIWKKISPKSRREVQRQYEEAMERRAQGGVKWWQKLFSRLGVLHRLWPTAKTWSGLSAEAMARDVGIRNFYDLAYRLASEAIHGTDLARHLKLVDETTFEMSKGIAPVLDPDHSATRETLITATLAFYLVLESIYKTLQNPRLAELTAQFGKIKDNLPKPGASSDED